MSLYAWIDSREIKLTTDQPTILITYTWISIAEKAFESYNWLRMASSEHPQNAGFQRKS